MSIASTIRNAVMYDSAPLNTDALLNKILSDFMQKNEWFQEHVHALTFALLVAEALDGGTAGVAAVEPPSSGEATTDQLLELAGALEQRRGLAIVEAVTALATGYHEGAFRAGFETACEEITLRLRTEVWDGCLPPIDAATPGVMADGQAQQSPHAAGCDALGGGTAFQQRPVSGRLDFPASTRHPVTGVGPRQADCAARPARDASGTDGVKGPDHG